MPHRVVLANPPPAAIAGLHLWCRAWAASTWSAHGGLFMFASPVDASLFRAEMRRLGVAE